MSPRTRIAWPAAGRPDDSVGSRATRQAAPQRERVRGTRAKPTELDTFPGWIEYALTRIVSLFTSRQIPTMTLPIALSAAAQRTRPPSISHLMQTALENPGIVSLAAGFVDQQSLPVELVGQSGRPMLLADPAEGRRSLQYGTTIGDLRLRARLLEYLERSDGRPAGSLQGGIAPNDRHDRIGAVDLSGLRGAAGPGRHRTG